MKKGFDATEILLGKYANTIGKDYFRYRNHVNRVFSYCLLLDENEDNIQKYAIAAVYHDIGIWTNKTIDYLGPSIAQARGYLIETGKQEWIEEITNMIHWHHKLSPYSGPFTKTAETFRKADWIDVSLGMVTFGIPTQTVNGLKKQLPNLGFHWFLIKQIGKNLIKHPFSPLPMFTR